MAKKNSTKTITKEKLQASEPRILAYRGWTGVNIKEAAAGWEPAQRGPNQQELPDQFLAVQNNVDTTSLKALETRLDQQLVAEAPAGIEFTGVACLQGERLFCAFSDQSIRFHMLGADPASWTEVPVTDPDAGQSRDWTEIGYYQDTLICLTDGSEIYVGSLETISTEGVSSSRLIPDPEDAPTLKPKGGLKEGDVSRIQMCYVYTNRFGSTLPSRWATIYTNKSPVEWSASSYLEVSGTLPEDYGITGVDVYCTMDDNLDAIFAGHVEIQEGQTKWSYSWLGALADTSVWTNVSLTIPTENNTKGVNAQHFNVHDGRLYFWGGDEKYRLWIGGNPGNELSVARGTGGAFVDIDPGTGTEVNGTAKFKTYSGSSIITVMCGNPNSGMVKRFNLLETNVQVTNELTSKGYMTEEVSNVVGCNSRWGYQVYYDGLYSVDRYGLAVTTMQMEYSNQQRTNYASDAIQNLFTDVLGDELDNARMVCLDGKIYIIMADDEGYLERLILVYDVNQKAWYTYTYDEGDRLLHMMSIDSIKHWEGLGLISRTRIYLMPTTSPKPTTAPECEVFVETGELTYRQPPSATMYLAQLEFKFDYFVGDLTILVEGYDYYGRRFEVVKEVSEPEIDYEYPVYMRIDMLVETFKITFQGRARFRLTHWLSKTYGQSNKVNLVYGFDTGSSYRNRHDGMTDVHHYLESYNNLRRSIVT